MRSKRIDSHHRKFSQWCTSLTRHTSVLMNWCVENFTDMIKYLEDADSLLSDKIERIDLKIENVNEEFVRTSNVY